MVTTLIIANHVSKLPRLPTESRFTAKIPLVNITIHSTAGTAGYQWFM